MQKNVAKGKMTEQEVTETLGRIKTTTDFKDFGNVDFVVEVWALCYFDKTSTKFKLQLGCH